MSNEYLSLYDYTYRYRRHAFYYTLCLAAFLLVLIIFYEPGNSYNWDSLDGIGYRFSRNNKIQLDPMFDVMNNLPACDLKNSSPNHALISQMMEEFQACINPIVQPMKGNVEQINLEFVDRTRRCNELPILDELKIVEMQNLHEIKWTILPKCKENNTMLTLGIGHDTTAEEKLNRTLPNTVFYGADPIIDPNRQLYSAFGTFFPFAVGRKAGMTKFRILPNQNQKTRKYIYQDVTTIDITYFLRDILNLKRIDIAWIDIEGGEFEFLDYFHNGAKFDQHGITICQFNLEVHSKFHPPGAQIFHDFIFRILEDKRYIFLKPVNTEVGVHRMFFVNLEDKECIAKFL